MVMDYWNNIITASKINNMIRNKIIIYHFTYCAMNISSRDNKITFSSLPITYKHG